jgi:hypothetical protein
MKIILFLLAIVTALSLMGTIDGKQEKRVSDKTKIKVFIVILYFSSAQQIYSDKDFLTYYMKQNDKDYYKINRKARKKM